ncbi:MAG: DNA (cytosine-5-)-methyltransferase [Coriobacteriia bacterium]|nr:DNA (cytosine-5-)-methyltransferase [Coriobacteriia bacterium]
MSRRRLTSLEICAGAGGQAIGLEKAGFRHLALVEIDKHACQTLRQNRPRWAVRECDLKDFADAVTPSDYPSLDLIAGGVPCPPFSIAGQQKGSDDERDLFPQAMRLVRVLNPRAVMIENVRGLMASRFDDYRAGILASLRELGYVADWRLLLASDFGVSQLRPRTVLVAIKSDWASAFEWPLPGRVVPKTVGEQLKDAMAMNGWEGAEAWAESAKSIAPTIVGGSKKHGGPDLGPTRAKAAWARLGVDGKGVANTAPSAQFSGSPKLTVEMVAALQGFPPDWRFTGGKTSSYRQVGNAFPPPVAEAVGRSIAAALRADQPLPG